MGRGVGTAMGLRRWAAARLASGCAAGNDGSRACRLGGGSPSVIPPPRVLPMDIVNEGIMPPSAAGPMNLVPTQTALMPSVESPCSVICRIPLCFSFSFCGQELNLKFSHMSDTCNKSSIESRSLLSEFLYFNISIQMLNFRFNPMCYFIIKSSSQPSPKFLSLAL